MLIMIGGSKYRKRKIKLADESNPFIPFLSTGCVELVIEIGRLNVQLIRVNAHDEAVLLCISLILNVYWPFLIAS